MFLVHFSLGISCWFYLFIYFLPHSNHSRRLCSFWLRDEELSSFEYFHKNLMVWWFDKSHAPSSIISVYNQSSTHCADVCRYSEREQHVFKSQQKKQKKELLSVITCNTSSLFIVVQPETRLSWATSQIWYPLKNDAWWCSGNCWTVNYFSAGLEGRLPCQTSSIIWKSDFQVENA